MLCSYPKHTSRFEDKNSQTQSYCRRERESRGTPARTEREGRGTPARIERESRGTPMRTKRERAEDPSSSPTPINPRELELVKKLNLYPPSPKTTSFCLPAGLQCPPSRRVPESPFPRPLPFFMFSISFLFYFSLVIIHIYKHCKKNS